MRSGSASSFVPIALGIVTLAGVAALLLRDAFPAFFPAGSHDTLGAFSLAMISLAYLAYQLERRAAPKEMVKAILLAAAFLFWAANQYWPNLPEATLFNDIAIALFVLDVFLVMIGWPLASNDGVFSEAHGTEACRCDCGCCGGRGAVSQRFDALMGSLRDVEAGRHFTREEFNE
ncbi:MAG: hypothetical protein WBA18_02345 [Terracidiphilus sp.]